MVSLCLCCYHLCGVSDDGQATVELQAELWALDPATIILLSHWEEVAVTPPPQPAIRTHTAPGVYTQQAAHTDLNAFNTPVNTTCQDFMRAFTTVINQRSAILMSCKCLRLHPHTLRSHMSRMSDVGIREENINHLELRCGASGSLPGTLFGTAAVSPSAHGLTFWRSDPLLVLLSTWLAK